MIRELKEKINGEKEFFTSVSKSRFEDLGFAHPSIDIQGAIHSGKQIMHSPYTWMNDVYLDSWNIRHLPQYRKKRQVIKEAVCLEGCSVVDIGCGSGSICLEMARYGANVAGIDLCEESIEIANLAKENARSSIKGSLKYEVANAFEIRRADNSIDAITMVGTIHHLPDASNYIEKIHRMLKTDGKLIILDHNSCIPRFNRYCEGIVSLILPSGYLKYKEKFTLRFFGGIPSKIFSFGCGLMLPNYIPLNLRLKYLFFLIITTHISHP